MTRNVASLAPFTASLNLLDILDYRVLFCLPAAGLLRGVVHWVLLHQEVPELFAAELAGPQWLVFEIAQVCAHNIELATRRTKDLAADATVMFPGEELIEFAIAAEAIRHVFVGNPHSLWADRGFDRFEHLRIHYL